MSSNNSNQNKSQKNIKLPNSVDPQPEFAIIPLIQATSEDSVINVTKIKELCSRGLDSSRPEDRAAAWLVLSHVFPTNPLAIPDLRKRNKQSYLDYIDIFNMKGYENEIYSLNGEVTMFREGIDNELMSLIYIDVLRTPHHLRFLPFQDNDIPINSPEDILAPFHQQMRRIERILYIFAKCNSTVSYLQGMNEIAAVLYYAFSMSLAFFSNDLDEMESFVFTEFQTIYGSTKLSEMYLLQDRSSIIQGRMNNFMQILEKHFPKGATIISKHNIHPLCFCFKWLSLLFSQEYNIPQLILIWDALFAHFDALLEYATYIAVAQVKMLEKRLDIEDYLTTMTALAKENVEDVGKLLHVANCFWREDHPPEKGQLLTKMSNFFKNIQLPHMNTMQAPNSSPKNQNH